MPLLFVLHKFEAHCATCGENLGPAGAWSQVLDPNGAVILFNDQDQPKGITLALECSKKHKTAPPDDWPLEWSFRIPSDAVMGCPAVASRMIAASGEQVEFIVQDRKKQE